MGSSEMAIVGGIPIAGWMKVELKKKFARPSFSWGSSSALALLKCTTLALDRLILCDSFFSATYKIPVRNKCHASGNVFVGFFTC
jgi:hypothetical protein